MFHFLFSIFHGLLLMHFELLGKKYTKSMDIQPYVSSSNPDGLRKLSFKTSLAQLTLCTLEVFAYAEVRVVSFLSGGFITAIVVNPPERKLANTVRFTVLRFDKF